MLLENRYGRERWRNQPTISLRAATYPPLAPPERLAEGARQDVDPVHHALQFVSPAAARADEAGGVRIVHHHQRAVAPGQLADLPEPRDRAVHREHPVGRDEAHARGGGVLERLLELVHVVVGIAQAPRLAEADAVDDAGVIERVADHGVLFPEQGLEQAAVGIEAGRIEDRVLHAEKRGEPLFELPMHALGAADEPHRGDAVAVAIERLVRRLKHRGMIGESQVVVGAEIDHLAAVGEPHDRALRGADDAFALEKAGIVERAGVALEPFAEILEHHVLWKLGGVDGLL